jgi:hypothetical protein
MNALLQPVQDLARGALDAMRAALRRGALVGAALLIATLGAAFLVFAGYIGLRFLIGPGLAALSIGAAFLALAAGVLLMARSAVPPDTSAPPLPIPPPTMPPRPADAATVAVFTVAFLLGRRLAAHLTDQNSLTKNS